MKRSLDLFAILALILMMMVGCTEAEPEGTQADPADATDANGTSADVQPGNTYYATSDDFVTTVAGSGTPGYADGVGRAALFNRPSGVAVDGYTRLLFVADTNNHVIRTIDLDTYRVTTLAGVAGVPDFINGRGLAAAFRQPTGLALALRSRQLYVCDTYNHAIRVVHVVSREVRTPALSEAVMPAPSAASTPMIITCGRTRFT